MKKWRDVVQTIIIFCKTMQRPHPDDANRTIDVTKWENSSFCADDGIFFLFPFLFYQIL